MKSAAHTCEAVELHVQISSDAAINCRALPLTLTLNPTRLHGVITRKTEYE